MESMGAVAAGNSAEQGTGIPTAVPAGGADGYSFGRIVCIAGTLIGTAFAANYIGKLSGSVLRIVVTAYLVLKCIILVKDFSYMSDKELKELTEKDFISMFYQASIDVGALIQVAFRYIHANLTKKND